MRKRDKRKYSAADEDDEAPNAKKPCTDECESNLKLLKEELKKKKPKSKEIKTLMDETEGSRREWIDNDGPTVQEVMCVYPTLRFQRWVSKF